MTKTCHSCTQAFEISEDDLAFYDKVSPVFGGKKELIPPPTLCPDCRQQRRLAQCNEHVLYPSTCQHCQKDIVSQYHAESGAVTYCRSCYFGEDWDPRSYGRDFDFSRPFFDQFLELRRAVPCQNLQVDGTNVNSDYIHYAGFSKNCYLIGHADFCEDCYYGYGFKKNVSCVDGFYNLHCELCYDCVDVHKSYGLVACQDCRSCHSSAFLRDCIGCKNCFLCVGLREAEYCIGNKQLTKEEYQKAMADVDLGSHAQYQGFRTKLKALEAEHSFKERQGFNLENCTGNYLNNCKNVFDCYDCEEVESARYCTQIVLGSKDIMDVYQFGTNAQQCYDCAIAGDSGYHTLFCLLVILNTSDMTYCMDSQGSNNCFGCVGLKRNSYCVLNKQYSKEEYEVLVPKIIEHMRGTGEWGEFFPARLSAFGYNETTAQEYFPLSKEEALKAGFRWSDYEAPPPQAEKVITREMMAKLPDNVKDTPDAILDWLLTCEVSGKPYRLTKQELRYYRSQGLPIPRRHPNQRHKDRMEMRNPRRLYDRECGNCAKAMRTTYAPERPEKVYCEECYLKEVY